MRVVASGLTLLVENVESVLAALARRDDRGGGFFWLAPDDRDYPAIALRVSGEVADVFYFPVDGHPGFRCLGGKGLPDGGLTTLVFDGCDPGTGEETPNKFVVPFDRARSLAVEFFRSHGMSDSVEWFEL